MSLTEDRETVLVELELILVMVKQIDTSLVSCIHALQNGLLPNVPEYGQLVARNINHLKRITELLQEM